MFGSHLAMKRSQSECLSMVSSKIYSPSPIKKASRICGNLAKELGDVPPRIEEFEFDFEDAPIQGIVKAKSCIFRSVADSSKYKTYISLNLCILVNGVQNLALVAAVSQENVKAQCEQQTETLYIKTASLRMLLLRFLLVLQILLSMIINSDNMRKRAVDSLSLVSSLTESRLLTKYLLLHTREC